MRLNLLTYTYMWMIRYLIGFPAGVLGAGREGPAPQVEYYMYGMSKKSWPNLYSYFLYNMGHTVLDRMYTIY